MSTVSLPLKTEIWQADRLTKMLENCRAIYNAVAGQKLKDYQRMRQDHPEYDEAINIIRIAYKSDDKKAKNTEEYKKSIEVLNKLREEYDLTEGSFNNVTTYHRRHYSKSISSTIAQCSIAKPVWSAFESLLYRSGKEVHFKKKGTLSSMASDGKSGFRVVDINGKTLKKGIVDGPMFLAVGGVGVKKMQIPIIVPNEEYKKEMVCREFHEVRVVQKIVKGRSRFCLHLAVDGVPEKKYDKSGLEKHPIGRGKLGIYIDAQTVTVVTEKGFFYGYWLGSGIDHFDQQKKALDRYMSHSRRINNPENYEQNGTVKKGRIADGVKVPLIWKNSKRYDRARNKKKNLFRVESENRLLERNRLANEILLLGNEIYINDYPFEISAKRKTDDGVTPRGTPAPKSREGKEIGENAPGAFVALLKYKLEVYGEGILRKIQMTPEKDDSYRSRSAWLLLTEGEQLYELQNVKETR